MFKIAVGNAKIYRALTKIPFFRKFFVFKITAIPHIEPEYFTHYMSGITIPGNINMTTHKDRFAEIDPITLNFLERNSDNIIHDVAISSGITTLELFNQLVDRHINFKLIVSEKYSHFFFTGKYFCRVYDAQGNLVEGYIWGLLAKDLSWKFGFSKLLFLVMRLTKDTGIAKKQCIPIFDKRLQALIQHGKIEQIEYDVFNGGLKDRFSYVRCMNLLNLCYFDERQLQKAIRLLMTSLKENGILQIGRTEVETGENYGKNYVTFFRKENDRLIVIHEVNGGSEVKGILK
jgi:hypothetical protein